MVVTYGCRQNSSDSERIKGELSRLGYLFCEQADEADLIIFNTCAVRDGAEDKVYGNLGALKALKRRKKGIILGICGCMAARKEVQERIRRVYGHVDFCFGTNMIFRLEEVLQRVRGGERAFILNSEEDDNFENDAVRDSNVVADLPIMQGCDNYCSYCIVPYVRGREKSRSSLEILNEAETLAKNGYKEILLLGQNVNSYKSDIDFPTLLDKVAQIKDIKRIRFVSSHPKDFSEEVAHIMAKHDNICNQLHLPFQSGSNKVLQDMNRKYTRERYISLIKMARSKMPNLAISSDVIVGFPTERQEDFEDTLDLVKELKLDMLFTFIYSVRTGTPAANMEKAMDDKQININFQKLLKVQKEIALEINSKLIGSEQEVLVEGTSKTDDGRMTGRNFGNKIVNFAGKANVGEITRIKIQKAAPFCLEGIQI